MKMKSRVLLLSLGILLGMSVVQSIAVFADDGVVSSDQQRINEDKSNIRQDKQNIHTANQNIVNDKANGNQAQLQKDVQARREAKRNKRDDSRRLAQDRSQKVHDEVHP